MLTKKQAAWLLDYIETNVSNSCFGDDEAVYDEWAAIAKQLEANKTPDCQQSKMIVGELTEFIAFAEENDLFSKADVNTAESIVAVLN